MSMRKRALGATTEISFRLSAATLLLVLFLGLSGCERKEEKPAAPAAESHPKIGILPEGATRPNIVFILIDALRADRLAAYGSRSGLSPTIDTIALTGVTFDECVAPAPWTLPSVASLFVSYYPGVHKATNYRALESMEEGKRAYQSVLSDEFHTLAEVLHDNGYQTAGFCANKFVRQRYGFAQGFDHFDTSFADNTVSGAKVNEAAFKWLEQRSPDKPFFLYLHYMDVHGPYNAAPEFMDPLMAKVEANPDKQKLTGKQLQRLNSYLRKPPPNATDPERFSRLSEYREYWVARYEAGVAEMDSYIKQLVRRLNELGLWDNAYVILLSDHGEALCEHDWWDHGYSQYQTDLHVPLILRWPDVLPPNMRVRRLASLIDVMPTLLEQLRIPFDEKIQGVSLVDHISNRLPPTPPLARFAEAVKSGPRQYALFADNTKLLVTEIPARKVPDGSTAKASLRPQLFNLATDPGEQFDLAEQNAQQVQMLVKLMYKFIEINMNTKPGLVVPTKAVDADTIKRLESLGYVGGEDEEANEPAPTSVPASEPGSQPAGESDAANP